MASKNKKIKEPGADKNVFNMIRDYCKAPWVSTNKELPAPNTFVLLAYYAGEDVGYRMVMGWLSKRVIKPGRKKKNDDYATSYYYFSEIDVNAPDDYRQHQDRFYYSTRCEEDNLASKYEVIEEDGKKVALIWFVCTIGSSAKIFYNSKSVDSTFFPDLNTTSCATKEYSKPDFWMYVPEIK